MKPEDKAKVQQALDALEWFKEHGLSVSEIELAENSITALRQLLEAELVQEPDAVVTGYYGGNCVVTPTDPARVFNTGTVFYTQPADLNLNCKSVQARLATQWGYVKAEKADHSEQDLDMVDHGDELTIAYLDGVHTGKQLAKREWVGLTYEEAKEIYTCIHGHDSEIRLCRAIEAKLKEKNT